MFIKIRFGIFNPEYSGVVLIRFKYQRVTVLPLNTFSTL